MSETQVAPGPAASAPEAGHRVARDWMRRHAATLAILFVALAAGTMVEAIGWNQTSHYALVRSIDQGHARIDAYQDSTGDKAFYRGDWYSARAPGLAFFTLPFYAVLHGAGVPTTREYVGEKHNNVMIWLLGLWAATLPAAVCMLLVRRMADRLEPGFGTAAAVTLGLGTLFLPFSAMLFSHVMTATLAFAAFAILWHQFERAQEPRPWPIAAAGLLIGYGITTEYPILFAGLVLGCYVLWGGRRPVRASAALRRGLVFAGAVLVGASPIALYDKWAFGSYTHIAYADIPKQHAGFFGIRVPNPVVAIELLLSSRGLLTLAPVLVMAVAGLILLYRRGRRAEAAVIAAVCLLYLAYNSGYYLPYGGTVPGPRFLVTLLPFVIVPLALAYRRFPGPTLALAAISIVGMVLPTITKPLVSAEGDTGIWIQLAGNGHFQATVGTVLGVHNTWVALIFFFVPLFAALVFAVLATRRFELGWRSAAFGTTAAAGWALYAAFGPALFGIDHAAGERIVAAGDKRGVYLPYGSHPITGVALIGLGAALVALLLALLLRGARRPPASPAGRLVPRRRFARSAPASPAAVGSEAGPL